MKLDLGADPVPRVFVSYAIPSVVGMLVMSTAQIVDAVFVGRFVGSHGLAAINLALPLILVFAGLSTMFATGGATLANIQRGAGNTAEANGLFSLTFLLLAGLGALLLLVGATALPSLAVLLGADASVAGYVTDYLGILFVFLPIYLLLFALDLFIRGDGHPTFPVVAMLLSALTNVALDYLFVARWGWGVEGAAWATGASQVLPCALMVGFLIRRTSWAFVRPRFRLRVVARMVYNGLSEFVDQVSLGASLYVFNLVLMARIGPLGVAAFSIAGYAGEIAGVLFFAIAQAIHPAVSFNVGAGNVGRVRAFRNAALGTNLVLGVLASALLFVFRREAAGVFVEELEVIELATEVAGWFSLALVFMGANIATVMYFTALDRPAPSALLALSRSLVLLLAALFLLPLLFGVTGIWLAFLAAEAGTAVMALTYLRRIPIPQKA